VSHSQLIPFFGCDCLFSILLLHLTLPGSLLSASPRRPSSSTPFFLLGPSKRQKVARGCNHGVVTLPCRHDKRLPINPSSPVHNPFCFFVPSLPSFSPLATKTRQLVSNRGWDAKVFWPYLPPVVFLRPAGPPYPRLWRKVPPNRFFFLSPTIWAMEAITPPSRQE